MADRDVTQQEMLFSDVPGDGEKVRAILAEWGVEESSIRRLMRHRHRSDAACEREATKPARGEPPRHAGN